ncbi:MAG: alpha/beta hydrolase, partial [Proteobacteria bacterium]|nr:alpha/beta hydrolase [Pseudomonadota bacterium]
DSAGGNLSAAVSLMSRDKNGPKISRQILLYPATNLNTLNTDSYRFFAKGYFLTRKNVEYYRALYLPDRNDWTHPLASPLLAENHNGLPSATIITAQMDPLRDEGRQYAEKLERAGVEVRYHDYEGMVHGFMSADLVLSQAHEALDEVAADLRNAFGM